MQQINREQRQTSARLLRQLPANIIRNTTLPFDQQNVNKNFQSSATNRLDKSVNQQLQTEFDTQRSLSSCPTYSSLSRQSAVAVDTHECGTQITTLTPTNEFENDEEDFVENSSPIDNDQIFLIEDKPFEQVEFMPISSGFGYYPYHYPTTMTERVQRPQIISRAPQFRNNQNGYNSKNPTKTKPRPTAIKQSSPRSDTFLVSNKQNEPSSKFSKVNGTRRAPLPAQPPPPPPPQPSDRKRTDPLQRKAPSRPAQKLLSPSSDQVDYGRKPVRFAQQNNPSAYPQRPAPPHPSDPSRRMRVTNDDYVIQRRRGPPPAEYIYDDDYRSDSPFVRSRSQRYVRVVRDAPYEDEDDEVYYVESPPARRAAKVIRRPPPPQTTEYVYADEVPARVRSRRPEVVYVDDDRPVEYEDEYIYVDEHGNQVDVVNQRRKSPQYVEYIYEDELDRKRSQKPKVIYVDDDDYDDRRRHRPSDRFRERPNPKNSSKHSSSTRIIYD